MRGERLRDLLPLAQEPGHPLLGPLALGGDRAHPLAVGVERRVAERRADLGQALLERVDLALDLLEPPPQLAHLARGRALARRPRARAGPGARRGGGRW